MTEHSKKLYVARTDLKSREMAGWLRFCQNLIFLNIIGKTLIKNRSGMRAYAATIHNMASKEEQWITGPPAKLSENKLEN